MADRWIITKKRYHEHQTLEAAQNELARLQAMLPEIRFSVHRIKTRLGRSRADEVIALLIDALSTIDAAWRKEFPDGPEGDYHPFHLADEHKAFWRKAVYALAVANGASVAAPGDTP